MSMLPMPDSTSSDEYEYGSFLLPSDALRASDPKELVFGGGIIMSSMGDCGYPPLWP